MAEEDEVDVEGDFEMKIGLDSSPLYDVNEPPSKSANLLPEFTQHPWMLEQGWSLDHCTDEKSKAVLEKMLQEEQQYINGRGGFKSKSGHSSEASVLPKPTSHKRPWTEQEKTTFFRGMEIYGRSWSRIAELIPSRTVQQVKNFGQQYIKMQTKQINKSEVHVGGTIQASVDQFLASVDQLIQAVTTAQPTVKVPTSTKSSVKSPPLSKTVRKPKSPRQRKKSVSQKQKTAVNTIKKPVEDTNNKIKSEIVRIRSVSDSADSDSEVDVDIEPDNRGVANDHDYGQDVVYRKLVESAGIDPQEDGDLDSDEGNCEDNPLETLATQNTNYSSEDIQLSTESEENKSLVIKQEVDCDNDADDDNEAIASTSGTCTSGVVPDNPVKEEVYDNDNPQVRINVDFNAKIEDVCLPSGSNEYDCVKLEKEEASDIVPNASEMSTEVKLEPEDEFAKIQKEDETSSQDDDTESDSPDEHVNECLVYTSNGEAVYLPNPTEELVLCRDGITDEERHIHCEFFDNRPGLKTADRYLKIRNFILDRWRDCKPAFLNKTSVRPGLKNCGDVNCIGRIHSYLEQVGAINFGCAQAQYNKPNRSSSMKAKKDVPVIQAIRPENVRPRKRRVRDIFGQWVDEKDLEGRTIEHPEEGKRSTKLPRVKAASYDPFKLVPCLNFNYSAPAPFTLDIEVSALVIMDTHAHLSKAEVIGLLGGQYDQEEGRLHISLAEPCDSLSTGMQCEMDPVSQTEASERILSKGKCVIGWYHSHPTFEPNPSVRDIETQDKFQNWFSQGGCPFLGIIISPYNRQNMHHESQVRCLMVSKAPETAAISIAGMPYQFIFQRTSAEWDLDELTKKMTTLAYTYSCFSNRVQMLHFFKSIHNITCLDKLLLSLDQYLGDFEEVQLTKFRRIVTDIFTKAYAETNFSEGIV